MRLSVKDTGAARHFYIIKSTYLNKKRSTKIVEKIGTEEELRQRFPGRDPMEVALDRLEELNQLEDENKHEVMPKFSNAKLIPKEECRSVKGGYLFLQKIYHQLSLHKLCQDISADYRFDFDLSDILSRLLYTRILEPGSKRYAWEEAQNYVEAPSFELHDVYRALEVLAKENDRIQEHVYKASRKLIRRNDKILFYDCTNYFFEIEEAEGVKQFGHAKDHKPNPLVQMGLFLDGSGFPLAFSLHPGNTSEQLTLRPLEERILKDFDLSQFIVCTDAGLSSAENRRFNNRGNRAFITTQPLKKLKDYLQTWALDTEGWELPGQKRTFSLKDIDEEDPKELQRVYYKSRWIKEGGLEQKLVVSFSVKYKKYLKALRAQQILRAEKKLVMPSGLHHKRPNDPRRFIKGLAVTPEGELADKTLYILDEATIAEDARYDGFYAVCTNLEDEPSEILAVNKQRWQIEEAFRTLKSEFQARPVYLQRDERILAHFMTCFLALLLFKILKQKLKEQMPEGKVTTTSLIQELKAMNFFLLEHEGYIPTYTRTDLTDALHKAFGFRTDYQILLNNDMKKVIKSTKI